MYYSLIAKFFKKGARFSKLSSLKCLPRFQQETSLERFMDSHHLLEEKFPHGSSIAGWKRDKSSLDALERESLRDTDKGPLDVLERESLTETFLQVWFLTRKCASVISSVDASRGKSAPSTLARCHAR